MYGHMGKLCSQMSSSQHLGNNSKACMDKSNKQKLPAQEHKGGAVKKVLAQTGGTRTDLGREE